MSEVRVPDYVDLMYPTLKGLDHLGGSATVRLLQERVPQIAGLTDGQMEVDTNWGEIKVFYHMRWARTYLQWAGAIENPKRSVWSITLEGRKYLRMDPEVAVQQLRQKCKEIREERKYTTPGTGNEPGGKDEIPPSGDWRSGLLTTLKEMKSDSFENLILQLMRKMGVEDYVDLIGGEQLCDLLKEHQLGVVVEERVLEIITLDRSFFADL